MKRGTIQLKSHKESGMRPSHDELVYMQKTSKSLMPQIKGVYNLRGYSKKCNSVYGAWLVVCDYR